MAKVNLQIPDGSYCSDKHIKMCVFETDKHCRIYDEELEGPINYVWNNSKRSTYKKCKICEFLLSDNNLTESLNDIIEEN